MTGIFTHREAYASGGPNIVPNPDLEANAVGWGGQGASVARSTSTAHSGAASLQVLPDGVSDNEGAAAPGLGQSFPVLPGQTYKVSAWVDVGISKTYRLTIEEWSHPDAVGGSPDFSTDVATETVGGGFQELSGQITLQATTHEVRLVVRQGVGQVEATSFNVDDVSFALAHLIAPIPVYRGSRIMFPPGPGRLAIKLRAGDSDAEPDILTENGDEPVETIRIYHRPAFTGLSDALADPVLEELVIE